MDNNIEIDREIDNNLHLITESSDDYIETDEVPQGKKRRYDETELAQRIDTRSLYYPVKVKRLAKADNVEAITFISSKDLINKMKTYHRPLKESIINPELKKKRPLVGDEKDIGEIVAVSRKRRKIEFDIGVDIGTKTEPKVVRKTKVLRSKYPEVKIDVTGERVQKLIKERKFKLSSGTSYALTYREMNKAQLEDVKEKIKKLETLTDEDTLPKLKVNSRLDFTKKPTNMRAAALKNLGRTLKMMTLQTMRCPPRIKVDKNTKTIWSRNPNSGITQFNEIALALEMFLTDVDSTAPSNIPGKEVERAEQLKKIKITNFVPLMPKVSDYQQIFKEAVLPMQDFEVKNVFGILTDRTGTQKPLDSRTEMLLERAKVLVGKNLIMIGGSTLYTELRNLASPSYVTVKCAFKPQTKTINEVSHLYGTYLFQPVFNFTTGTESDSLSVSESVEFCYSQAFEYPNESARKQHFLWLIRLSTLGTIPLSQLIKDGNKPGEVVYKAITKGQAPQIVMTWIGKIRVINQEGTSNITLVARNSIKTLTWNVPLQSEELSIQTPEGTVTMKHGGGRIMFMYIYPVDERKFSKLISEVVTFVGGWRCIQEGEIPEGINGKQALIEWGRKHGKINWVNNPEPIVDCIRVNGFAEGTDNMSIDPFDKESQLGLKTSGVAIGAGEKKCVVQDDLVIRYYDDDGNFKFRMKVEPERGSSRIPAGLSSPVSIVDRRNFRIFINVLENIIRSYGSFTILKDLEEYKFASPALLKLAAFYDASKSYVTYRKTRINTDATGKKIGETFELVNEPMDIRNFAQFFCSRRNIYSGQRLLLAAAAAAAVEEDLMRPASDWIITANIGGEEVKFMATGIINCSNKGKDELEVVFEYTRFYKFRISEPDMNTVLVPAHPDDVDAVYIDGQILKRELAVKSAFGQTWMKVVDQDAVDTEMRDLEEFNKNVEEFERKADIVSLRN